MNKRLLCCWLRTTIGFASCAVALAVLAQATPREHVRAELARLQRQTGQSLVSFEGGGHTGDLSIVAFPTRSLSEEQFLKKDVGQGAITSDGTEIAFQLRRKTGQTYRTPLGVEFPQYQAYLAIIRRNGTNLREYPDLEDPYKICWPQDKSALAIEAKNPKQGKEAARGLHLLNLRSGATYEIDAGGYVTTQCSSPDGKQIVYEVNGTLKVYDILQRKSWELAKGERATWSPDGNWIAFLVDDKYYAIRPSGEGRKLLFKKKDALTPLWWSPDSRFVAYVSRNRLFEGFWSWPPEERGRLRVRRLQDNAEDWVAELFVFVHVQSFQWVKSEEVTSGSQ